ncbi:uncharacterized protein BDW47DRAFT_59673 [Aspergillus candidus]|uniref:Uncharacterized protein n=1 Tax=Aspergillus candidus TaxID=41067 RepID=A0A2I2F5B4_ASPCN|nr:hypothetical protein BDW47DRAFT_59673 [Aspergillus candidus]PLB35814.1 hypothetical protein BDW47DRAFT_59673 [Aspergillus candidus]
MPGSFAPGFPPAQTPSRKRHDNDLRPPPPGQFPLTSCLGSSIPLPFIHRVSTCSVIVPFSYFGPYPVYLSLRLLKERVIL